MYFHVTFKSMALMRAADLHVFLPFGDGYPGAPEPFPTLYFLPGYSASASELAFCFPWREWAAETGMAVVIPDGENAFYTDEPTRATFHGRYAAEEIVEVTRRMFPQLSREREKTFIGGISMGGYGAAVLGLNHPETFSKIAMFSPAIAADRLLTEAPDAPGAVPGTLYGELFGGEAGYRTPRHDPILAVDALLQAGRPVPPLFLCCGTEDLLVGEGCRDFLKAMEKRGVPVRSEWGSGTHDLNYWDEHIPNGMRFLAE